MLPLLLLLLPVRRRCLLPCCCCRREPDDDDDAYPLPLPLAPLRRLVGDDDKAVEAMVECLTDGPPQHSLANAAMLLLLEGMLRR